jgi:deoxycytidine triphosphate deaminase
MIIGNESLKDLFPEFEDCIKENGLDLKIGSVEHTTNRNNKLIGCIDGEKHLPVTYEVAPSDGVYKFYPHNYYTIVVDRPIHIPEGYCQFYFIRSTFARCGLMINDAVGDNGFEGTLRIGVYNANNLTITAGLNEAIIQAVTIKNDGTAKTYNGDYKEDKIYESTE